MESLTVQQKSPKQSRAKKKPIKVVYISTPMKVKTSASKFRALVQELTGQDSDIADNIAKYRMIESTDESLGALEPGSEARYDPGPVRQDPNIGGGADLYKSAANPLEMFDEAFAPTMLENYPEFMSPMMFYEPQGSVFRNFHGV